MKVNEGYEGYDAIFLKVQLRTGSRVHNWEKRFISFISFINQSARTPSWLPDESEAEE